MISFVIVINNQLFDHIPDVLFAMMLNTESAFISLETWNLKRNLRNRFLTRIRRSRRKETIERINPGMGTILTIGKLKWDVIQCKINLRNGKMMI